MNAKPELRALARTIKRQDVDTAAVNLEMISHQTVEEVIDKVCRIIASSYGDLDALAKEVRRIADGGKS